MSEQQNEEVNIEDLQKQLADKDTMLKDIQSQFDAVKGKADQLLDETKKAKAVAREKADAAELANMEKAKKNGDFEQLLKSSEQQRKDLEDRLTALNSRVGSERTRTESMKLAAELADGTNAELLSEFISKRIKYTDDGIKVLDSNGDLTVSSLEDLKREFESNDRFKSLLRGNKSSGGGASGDGGGASGKMTIERSSFDKMDTTQRAEFMKKGGTLTD